MIAIINTGEVNEVGEHRYRLQINDMIIGEFHHQRRDGLAVCLQRAAGAAEAAQQREDKLIAGFLERWEKETKQCK